MSQWECCHYRQSRNGNWMHTPELYFLDLPEKNQKQQYLHVPVARDVEDERFQESRMWSRLFPGLL